MSEDEHEEDDQILEIRIVLARREAGGRVDAQSLADSIEAAEMKKDKPPAVVPWIELPRDGRLLSHFAKDVGAVCAERVGRFSAAIPCR